MFSVRARVKNGRLVVDDPTPSREDLATTAHLMAAGKLMGVPVLDHIIVTRDSRRWYSMASRGTSPEA